MDKIKVAVRCPNMGFVSSGVTALFCMLERASFDPRCPYEFDTGMTMNVTPWDYARNCIVGDFLKGDFDRLWFIDSDILPSPRALRLLWVDADIASAPYPIWGKWGKEQKQQIQWSVYQWVEGKNGYEQPEMPDEGVLERDGVATGMTIYRRHVFEDRRMWYPGEYTSFAGEAKQIDEVTAPAVFQNKHCPNGKWDATEDLDFCYRAKKLGYTIKVDYSIKNGHIKTVDVLDIAKYSLEAYEIGFSEALESCGVMDEDVPLIQVAS